MLIIAFANPKGGTGKTTSALLLAEQFAHSGAKLAILDCDPNQNLVAWDKERAKAGRKTLFDVLERPSEDEIIEVIDSLEDTYDYLIIDLEGTAAQIVTFALSRADMVLIPLEPNSVEARHAARAVQLVIRTGKMLKRDVPYSLVFTRCNAAFATKEETEVRNETKQSAVKVLSVGLVRRSAYTKIFGDYSLLSELHKTAPSEREKLQLEKSIVNAREYAKAVAELMKGEGTK